MNTLENPIFMTRTRRKFHVQVAFATAFTVLTSGVFLSGLAIYMGASDVLVGYISTIANICGISILFLASFIERFQSLKKVTIVLSVLAKLVTLSLVLIPLLVPKEAQIIVLIVLVVLAFTLQAQSTVVLNNWLVMFVQQKKSGKNIAVRQTFVIAVTVAVSLSGGRFLDAAAGSYAGFAVLFSIALLMSAGELITFFFLPDAIKQRSFQKKVRMVDSIRLPLKTPSFLLFAVYIFFFYLLLFFADSFTTVYMIRYLNLSFTEITGFQMILTLPQVVLLTVWGKIADKKGHRFSLIACITFFIGEVLFLAFSNVQNLYVFVPIAFSFAAVANAGFTISVFNRRYELMPKAGRILYENFYVATVGLAFILAPLLGNGIKTLFESSSLANSVSFSSIQFLYGLSAVAILLLQIVAVIVVCKSAKKARMQGSEKLASSLEDSGKNADE